MPGPAPRRWVAALLDHPRLVALGTFVGGLLLGPALAAVCWWLAAALVLAALAAVASAGELGGRLALVLALTAAAVPFGGWLASARLHALDRSALGPWIAHAADLRATVLQAPRARTFGRTVALAKVDAGPGRGERILIEVKGAIPAGVGEQVRISGGFRALPDFEQAARRAGAHALVAADTVTATGVRRGGVLGAVDAVRRRAERALAGGLLPPLAGLARGMVLGEDDQLTPDTTADFRASGLAHLVAASGSNVALLAAMVLALGALVGLPRTVRLGLALVLVAGYVPLAGGGPSIQRAGIMGAATLVAALASQPASRVYALLLAAASTLALNPRSVGDPGWQLSFAAVLGLMALAPPLRAGIARRWPRLHGAGAEALAVSVAAAASTAPLIALTFGRLSWVTVPANLLALPVVAPIMWLGAAAAVVGQASVALAAPLMVLAAWPLAFLTAIGHLFATLPGAQAPVALPAAAAAAWWAVLAALAVSRVRAGAARLLAPRPVRAALTVAAATGVLAAAAGGAGGAPGPPAGLVVSALDIGQGDATLIQDRGAAILVDTGPPAGPILRRLHEAGVRRLDLLVITHAQADHEGGAAAVLGALPVGMVLDGRDGVRSPDGDRFAAVARARHVRLVAPAAGQRLRVGPAELDVLSPAPEPAALHVGADPNQRAIVAEVRDGGFSMLLTADTESDVLGGLPLEPVDVLKVAHHGSADPGLPALLQRLRPAVALIEVGAHNSYGHPAPATVSELDVVPHVLRTDRDGTVRLHVEPGPPARIAIQTHA